MYISYQDYINEHKVEKIKASMEQNGWQGASIVVWGDTLITGNHRYAACNALDVEPETITLEEIFEEDGLNFDECHEKSGYPTANEIFSSDLLHFLSDEIIEKYGIQF